MASARRFRIGIGVHNLSTRSDRVIRTGIQEVVFQTLKTCLCREFDGIEFVPIFRLPNENYSGAVDFRPTHVNSSPGVLRATFAELGVNPDDVCKRWPYLSALLDPNEPNLVATDNEICRLMAGCDGYFEPVLCDTRHIIPLLRNKNPNYIVGHLVHDVGPLVHPEYVAEGMFSWFGHQYMKCIHACDYVITNSRHTAIDTARFLPVQGTLGRHQYYVALPTPTERAPTAPRTADDSAVLQELGIAAHLHAIVSVATLEPRKNLEATVKAFLRLRELRPDLRDTARLVLVGIKGWNNATLLNLIEEIGTGNIIQPGYVSEATLDTLFRTAACVMMPSHYEGFGIPVSRARFSGSPSITCINSSLPEAGLLAECMASPFDIDEIACAMAKAIDSRASINNRAEPSAPPLFEANETWDSVLDGWANATLTVCRERLETAANPSVCQHPEPLPRTSIDCFVSREPRRFALDLHNISIRWDKIHKTGIQEVVARMLQAVPAAQKQLGESTQIVPVPILIPQAQRRGFIPTLSPSWNLYEKLLHEIGIPAREFGPEFMSLLSGDVSLLERTLKTCDWLTLTSLTCADDIPNFGRIFSAGTRVSHVLYDAIPLLMPEHAHQDIAKWFSERYLPSLRSYARVGLSISRHTALEFERVLGPEFQGSLLWRSFPSFATPSNARAVDGVANVPLDRPYFLVIGSTDPRKNIKHLLEAYQKLIAEKPNSPRLVLVGASGWKNEELGGLFLTAEASGHLVRPGYVSDDALALLVTKSCGILMPSRYEGFGIPVSMAVAAGVPVLTCNNSSLPEAAMGGAAIFVDPANIDDIMNGLVQLTSADKHNSHINHTTTESWADYLCSLVDIHFSLSN